MGKNEYISYLNNEYPSVRIMNVCGKLFVYDAKTCSLTLLSEREDEKKKYYNWKNKTRF